MKACAAVIALLCVVNCLAFPFIPLASKVALEKASNDPRAPPFKSFVLCANVTNSYSAMPVIRSRETAFKNRSLWQP
jgi:hypothetical protein